MTATRVRRAASLILVVLLAGMASGCGSDSDQIIRATRKFYEAALRGDCTTAVTYTSPAYRAGGRAAKSCAALGGQGYQIVTIEASPNESYGFWWAGVRLSRPSRDFPFVDQGPALIRGPHGFLIDSIGGTT